MEALVLFSTPEAEEAAAGTTKKAAAPTAPLFASRTGRMEMKLVTVMAMVAPWPGMTIFFFWSWSSQRGNGSLGRGRINLIMSCPRPTLPDLHPDKVQRK